MLRRILNALRAVQIRVTIVWLPLLDNDLLSSIFFRVSFIRCRYNENERTIGMRERSMNLLITYDMSMRVCACECMCEPLALLVIVSPIYFCKCANDNPSCSLRHHFARCQPFLHVITEDRGDIDEYQKSARHPKRQHRGFRWTRLHDGHCFIWK